MKKQKPSRRKKNDPNESIPSKYEPGGYTSSFRTPQKFGAASSVRRPVITEQEQIKYERLAPRAETSTNVRKKSSLSVRPPQSPPAVGPFLRCECGHEVSEVEFIGGLPKNIDISSLNEFRSIAGKVTCRECKVKGRAKVIFKQLKPKKNSHRRTHVSADILGDYVASDLSVNRVFHKLTCQFAIKIRETDKVFFKTANEAKNMFYDACKFCRPK